MTLLPDVATASDEVAGTSSRSRKVTLLADSCEGLLAGKLSPVRAPGPAEEALRDLVRAREDIRGDLMRARHRLSELLSRYEVRFTAGPGPSATEPG